MTLQHFQQINRTSVPADYLVLAVDDDPAMLRSLSELLTLRGFNVITAGNAREALDILKARDVQILLLDLHMRGIDGFELMAKVREQGMDVFVIVVSGDSSIDAAIESLRRGACDYVRKPYAPEALLKTVENAVHRRSLEKENRLIREHLKSSEQLHRFMVNNSPDLVYMLDEQGHFTFLNDRAESMLGLSRKDLIGHHYSTIVSSEDRELAQHCFEDHRHDDRVTSNLELRLRRNASHTQSATEIIHVELTHLGLYSTQNGQRHLTGSYGVARDVTERKHTEEIIKHQAYHDLLTGLPNRTLFMDRLLQALNHAQREKNLMAVVFLDLDRFKLVNDTVGHTTGDELLRTVARRLKSALVTVQKLAIQLVTQSRWHRRRSSIARGQGHAE